MEQLTSYFRNKRINTILDVGTGSGNFIPELMEALPDVKLTGVDPSNEALEDARLSYPEFKFVEMFGEELNFDDNYFDAASISMALHHLPNVPKTLAEMQRVVKPGGWIIVNELFSNDLNEAQKVHKQMHHFRSRIDRLKGKSHNETFTKSEILELVKSAGLQIDFHFENKKAQKKPTCDEISERREKLLQMLEDIKHLPEYAELSKEVPLIEKDLALHGFQMATCVVVIAKVK